MAYEPESAREVGSGLSDLDLGRVAAFLADAADEFSQHSCNDFTFGATAENKAILTWILKWRAEQVGEDSDSELLETVDCTQPEHGQLCFYDNWVMSYFSERCAMLAKNAPGAPDLSPAELNLIADLFDRMIAWREIAKRDHDVTVKYTVSATDYNKRFIAKVIKHGAETGWEQKATDILNSEEEVAVIDILIMRYYSDRCKALTVPR